MAEAKEVLGFILVIVGLIMMIIGLALGLRFPNSLDEVAIVAKGWVDGFIVGGVGTTVFLGGIAILKKS